MSPDTSDTSDICPRTLAGHWPDTLGHTGHTFGQTRCAGMSKCPKVSPDTLGHFRTQRFSLSLHTIHTHITGESIHIPSAECRLKESMGDNVSYSTQRLNKLSSIASPFAVRLSNLCMGLILHQAEWVTRSSVGSCPNLKLSVCLSE